MQARVKCLRLLRREVASRHPLLLPAEGRELSQRIPARLVLLLHLVLTLLARAAVQTMLLFEVHLAARGCLDLRHDVVSTLPRLPFTLHLVRLLASRKFADFVSAKLLARR